MIKCPACGFDNKTDAKFCLNCGADLSKVAQPEAYDPVGEEATVLIDPAQMQKRIAEEIKRERAVEAVARLSEPAPATRGAVPQAPPPAVAAPAPVSAPPAPAAAPAPAKGGSTVIVVILIVVVLFLLLAVAGLLVAVVMMRS